MAISSCWNCTLLLLDRLPGLCSWFPESKIIPVSIVDEDCRHFKPDTCSSDDLVNRLWKHAHKMADFTDSDAAPFNERKELIFAIFSIGKRIDQIKGEHNG